MSRLPLLLLGLSAAALGGTMAGTAATGGMSPVYRGAEPPPLGAERETLAWAREEATAWTAAEESPVRLASMPVQEPSVPCTDCSDFDVGYRWAERHGAEEAADCAADASAFADGCAAWLARQERAADTG